jgi:hypothetical protein
MINPVKRKLHLHTKLPLVDHIPLSYPYLVCQGALERLQKMPWFADFTFSDNKSVQIQPQDIPFCGVYFINEANTPDGDANVGEPRFRCMTTIGFSVIVQYDAASTVGKTLDIAYQAIIRGLLSDPTFYNNKEFKIQAFTRGMRQHVYGAIGKENEMPIAEMRFELTCDLGTITYEPFVPDILETVRITTKRLDDVVDLAVQEIDTEVDWDG